MAIWPASMTLGTLTADFRNWLGGDYLDAVVYVSSGNALTSQSDNVIVPRLETRLETVLGVFSRPLPVNNDPDWLPNSWSYIVRANFSNGIKMAWVLALTGDADLARIGVEIPYPDSLAPFIVVYPLPPSGGGSGAVDSVFGRTGTVTAATNDYSVAQINGLSAALSAKANLSGGAAFTGAVTVGAQAVVVTNDSRLSDSRTPTLHSASHAYGAPDEVTLQPAQVNGLITSLALLAPLASPTFTGTVSGITKAMVGLGSVDNTADTAKPVSTAQQTALNLKANLASPTFTGTVAGITAAMVGAQPLTTNLTTLGGLTPTTGNMILSVGSAWASSTPASVKTALAIAQADVSGLTAALALLAPLASPALTGTATVVNATYSGRIVQGVDALTDAATIAVDASLGNHFSVTLGGNRTLGNPTNAPGAGFTQVLNFALRQDASGPRTLTLDTNYRYSTDIPSITLSTAANKTDYLTVKWHQADGKWDVVAFEKGH